MQFQFDLHSFDQNILSFENGWIFRYFSFTFYIQFNLFAEK